MRCTQRWLMKSSEAEPKKKENETKNVFLGKYRFIGRLSCKTNKKECYEDGQKMVFLSILFEKKNHASFSAVSVRLKWHRVTINRVYLQPSDQMSEWFNPYRSVPDNPTQPFPDEVNLHLLYLCFQNSFFLRSCTISHIFLLDVLTELQREAMWARWSF